MSSFRNILKSDTPSAGVGGQGSHFPKNDDSSVTTPAADNFGSTVTGTEPNTVGPSDTSAAPTSATQAQATAGPEAGGSGHVGTTSAVSSGLSGDRTTAASSDTPSSTTHSFPQTLRAGQNTSSASAAPTSTGTSTGTGTGTAAVGETTTYSSRPLGSGDPTGSIVDHQSTDPLTYKIPEAGSHSAAGTAGMSATPTSSSAVTSSDAAKAASLAWAAQNKNENMPGEYPEGNENPYRASNLDPRVDGGKMGSAINQPSSSLPSRTRETEYATTGPAPSTLTTTADPTARSAEYAASADTKVPSTTAQIPVQSQSTPVATAESGEQQSIIGRTLGAMGLGGAASAAAGYLGYGAAADSSDEPRDTSAVASQPGLVSQETGPPKHYRRESIPTTAYPGGLNSPRAVAPPVGGTRDSIDQGIGGSDSRISNDRGIGGTPATIGGVTGSGFGLGSSTSGVPKEEYSQAANTRESAATQSQQSEARDSEKQSSTSADKSGDQGDRKTGLPGTATADAIDAGAFPLKQTNAEANLLGSVDKDPATVGGPSGIQESSSARGHDSSSHAGRDIAAGGAAAAATGAGAHALQHHEKSEDLRSSASQDASRDQTLSGGQSYTISHQTAPVDAISSRDPNTRGTASGTTGLGSISSSNAPIGAVASAPGRYDGQDYNQRDSHAGRDAALGAGAGAAAVGGLSHASGDRSSNTAPYYDAITVGSGSTGTTGATGATELTGATATTGQIPNEEGFRSPGTTVHDVTTTDGSRGDRTARNVGLGAAAGGAAYAAHEHSNERDLEKQREHDAKEAEKREKHHQKELEKQEKHHHKELEKHEKEEREAADKREKARLADEEEIPKRHEREAAAGVGAGGAAGEAHHHHEKEKKPSIFKRIFKRRKNKDTGEDEDYSTDDEEDKARHHAAGSSTGRGLHSGTEGEPRDSITGLAYDPSKDPEAAARLSAHEGTGHIPPYGSENATEGHILGSEPLGYVGDTRR